jgi:chaperonin GroES
MQLNPLHDRVVVQRIVAESKTASGLFIPDNAKEKPDQGLVLAVGPGKRNPNGDVMPLTVQVNNRVLFGKFAGQQVKIDGKELLILTEEEIYGIIEE